MNRLKTLSMLSALASLAVLYLAGVSGRDVAGTLVRSFPGVSAAAASKSDVRGQQTFTQEEALVRLTAAADTRVRETIGVVGDGGVGGSYASIQGRALALSDLGLEELRFSPSALRVESSAGTYAEFVAPTDAWIAVWTTNNAVAPDWGNVPIAVKVVVVMKDGTGEIRSMHVMRVNPAAEPLSN
ncbi:MAG: hypothetical protein ABI577_04780 [bacterium]